MSEWWNEGNAARDPSYADTASNPYKPVDYAARLKNAGKRPVSHTENPGRMEYAPGQLYGSQWMTPPKPMEQPSYQAMTQDPVPGQPYVSTPISYDPLTPPAPFPADPIPAPSYWQPKQPRRRAERVHEVQDVPAAYPQQAQAGMPYSADIFQHQPTAYMPTGNPDDIPYEYREPEPYFEPAYEAAPAQQEWRDPFTPAAPKQDAPAPKMHKAAAPVHPPIRKGRVLALAAAAAMLLFCLVVGGSIVVDLMHNERDLAAKRDEYRQRTGTELQMGAARVELLPGGQTFPPTPTPAPTPVRPTPTPVIPINAAALGLAEVTSPESGDLPTATPSLRSRLTSYPLNPMCNVMESLSNLVSENPDVVGHLVIDGVLDEIVMQRNNTYYLTHNSLGVTSQAGAVFADESCTFRLPPENLLLRGQSAVPGKIFAPLWQFVQGGQAFVAQHNTARLTTLYEENVYELFAVIVADSDPASPGYFSYAAQPTFTTDEAMMHYVQSARQRSLYQFSANVQPTDRLLTLATLGSQSCVVLLYAAK